MSDHSAIPRDPDLRGVPDALLRAAEKARRLAEQTGTPFIVREPEPSAKKAHETGMNSTLGDSSVPIGST
jgi:hypothetical protein